MTCPRFALPQQIGCRLETQVECPLPCSDPPAEPSTVLELHEALFSWDPVGTSQETFISHLEVKKVRYPKRVLRLMREMQMQ